MNKTAIKNFSIWARNKLIADVSYRAGLMGITANGIDKPLQPQSTATTEFYHIGTKEPYQISGEAIGQRRRLVEVMERKARETDYDMAYHYVLEEVAYTWFNRLIAIRFMEVNDYLPSHIRVLSSETGKMEPDLVTTPFDAELDFTGDEKDAILRMQRDNDVDGLFHLLFIKQCNALNAILPGLFEKTNDYTELLLNLSVIDREGVVYHLVHDIDEDDFNIEKGGQVEIIGWLYQYWNTEPKAAVFGRPSGTKVKKEEIPAATQLFTPHWIVRYMVENSLGRLFIEQRRKEGLYADGRDPDEMAWEEVEAHRIAIEKNFAEQMGWKYYLPEAEQTRDVRKQLDELQLEYEILKPEDIRCIDPCCGSGHILAYMFDVLVQIYESRGYSARDAAQSIVRFNLHGLDIDKRAAQLAYFSVMMKARQYDRRFFSRNLQPMVYSTAGDEDGENFGSLVKVDDPGEMPEDPQTIFEEDDYEKRLNAWSYRYLLAQKYHVVCTNPPYMGGGGMNGELAGYAKKYYPDSKSDASTVFMERTLQLCDPTGFMSMINIPVWMFLSSYEKLRQKLLSSNTILNMVHPGRGIFGSDFGTTTFVVAKQRIKQYVGTYRRLFDKQGEVVSIEEREKAFLSGKGAFTAQQDIFFKIPGSPIAYSMSRLLVSLFDGQKVGDYCSQRMRISTGDNDRFLRLWYEVNRTNLFYPNRWVAFSKGGEYRKWYGNWYYVLDYKDNGNALKNFPGFSGGNDDYYFKPGLVWTDLSSGKISFRDFPPGGIACSAGPMIYADSEEIRYYLAGFLNSNVANEYVKILCVTIHFQWGDIAKFPLVYEKTRASTIVKIVKNIISLSKSDWDSFEISWDFQSHPLFRCAAFSMQEMAEDAKHHIQDMNYVEEAFVRWSNECYLRFEQLKANEEELNRIFIDIYGLQDELTPEVEDKDVTVRKADLGRDVRSLLSYAVGCMFGRYSLDVEGLAYAGGAWDASKYNAFLPDTDGILPITDEEYLEDDIVTLLCKWLKTVYGQDTLEENLDFIAEALGNKGTTSREVIRNYFLKDFFADHCKIYQKRPIYWLFDSGKQNGFKALIYLHRYTPDTIGNVRVDYLHRLQRIYESEIDRMQDMIDHSKSPREAAGASKSKEKLQKQLKECRDYDGKIGHLALSRIELDLDDGVKVNYRKVQTASDGKFYEVLADSRNIIGKK